MLIVEDFIENVTVNLQFLKNKFCKFIFYLFYYTPYSMICQSVLFIS